MIGFRSKPAPKPGCLEGRSRRKTASAMGCPTRFWSRQIASKRPPGTRFGSPLILSQVHPQPNDGYGVDCGPSRGGPGRRTIRPRRSMWPVA